MNKNTAFILLTICLSSIHKIKASSDLPCTKSNEKALIYFNAEIVRSQVTCSWETASEIKYDHFIIERSLDGITFEEIGKVDGAGNSNAESKYSFTDKAHVTGISYYRLRQVESGGAIEISDVAIVRFQKKATDLVISPNPAAEFIQCSFTLSFACNADLLISDLDGEKYFECNYTLNKGLNTVKLYISNLTPGYYYITIKNNELQDPVNLSSKFLKK